MSQGIVKPSGFSSRHLHTRPAFARVQRSNHPAAYRTQTEQGREGKGRERVKVAESQLQVLLHGQLTLETLPIFPVIPSPQRSSLIVHRYPSDPGFSELSPAHQRRAESQSPIAIVALRDSRLGVSHITCLALKTTPYHPHHPGLPQAPARHPSAMPRAPGCGMGGTRKCTGGVCAGIS
ncbi:hypothetical protein P280DRAFT_474839 [Massarina eburnea CBS 473.64]|uniref:Uncharacterized protein n=1 Tax=Massarina eburnea CBS 473.64 TaxID=1395130 RepID=A0A6A6RFN4_9PLEO|nr:hypothetical protein P280DRAFT_474839 [Massarina eburnea CBS 473.64]